MKKQLAVLLLISLLVIGMGSTYARMIDQPEFHPSVLVQRMTRWETTTSTYDMGCYSRKLIRTIKYISVFAQVGTIMVPGVGPIIFGPTLGGMKIAEIVYQVEGESKCRVKPGVDCPAALLNMEDIRRAISIGDRPPRGEFEYRCVETSRHFGSRECQYKMPCDYPD